MAMRARLVGWLATLVMAWASGACADGAVTERTIERSDLSATIYAPDDGSTHPALLILGGAEGGREWAEAVARRLAKEGYIANAQTYFKGQGLPEQLMDIPLERFQAAIDYLRQQPLVDRQHLGVIGISKGAEAALVLAAHDNRVTAVVAASPSDVVWQGIDRKGGAPASSWTFHGEPLAYVPFKPCPDCKGLLDLYHNSRSAGAVASASYIAVENIHGPVMLISSANDQVWPSTTMAHSIADRLHRSGFPFAVDEVDYAEGGHFAFGIPPTEASAKEDTGFGGGDPGSLAKVRQDSWNRVIRFLAGALATDATVSR